jgi:hypothetical protein
MQHGAESSYLLRRSGPQLLHVVLQRLERSILADLKRMERLLRDVVAQCADGTLPECPLIETLFGTSHSRFHP